MGLVASGATVMAAPNETAPEMSPYLKRKLSESVNKNVISRDPKCLRLVPVLCEKVESIFSFKDIFDNNTDMINISCWIPTFLFSVDDIVRERGKQVDLEVPLSAEKIDQVYNPHPDATSMIIFLEAIEFTYSLKEEGFKKVPSGVRYQHSEEPTLLQSIFDLFLKRIILALCDTFNFINSKVTDKLPIENMAKKHVRILKALFKGWKAEEKWDNEQIFAFFKDDMGLDSNDETLIDFLKKNQSDIEHRVLERIIGSFSYNDNEFIEEKIKDDDFFEDGKITEYIEEIVKKYHKKSSKRSMNSSTNASSNSDAAVTSNPNSSLDNSHNGNRDKPKSSNKFSLKKEFYSIEFEIFGDINEDTKNSIIKDVDVLTKLLS